ncbi:hypothetical protein GCM10019059_39220 [Camelimonas fluminis]|nr:hypothetical protein GCM10019059_39220 [Camelimonas fluminis]
MARYAFFADLSDGTILDWRDTLVKGKVQAARGISAGSPRDIKGYDSVRGWVKITRKIELKANPSRHDCDSRCFNATGRTMQCECSCGGKNHGRGSLKCDPAS